MGVTVGPGYWTQCVEATFIGMSGRTMLPYLDDLACPCNSFEQGCERLHAMLERLEWANLSVAVKKMHCFALETSYLGYVVGRFGVRACPLKLEAVAKIKPTSINILTKK